LRRPTITVPRQTTSPCGIIKSSVPNRHHFRGAFFGTTNLNFVDTRKLDNFFSAYKTVINILSCFIVWISSSYILNRLNFCITRLRTSSSSFIMTWLSPKVNSTNFALLSEV
jgi:hypothetical protein